jgi:hypothetical protein
MNHRIESAMKAYVDAGISVIPINARTKRPAWWLLPQATDETGRPLFTKQQTKDDGSTFTVQTTENTGKPKRGWMPYQKRIATHDEVNDWVKADVQALAVVGGQVSGGLEILDFDRRGDETWYAQWAELAGDPVTKYKLPQQRTGGDGFQVAWRSEAVGGNLKLAWITAPEEDSGRKAMIETRHDNGYALWAPSLHPSMNHYRILNSTLSQVPVIDVELRNHFHDCARKLCQAPDEVKVKKPSSSVSYADGGGHEVKELWLQKNNLIDRLRRYCFTHLGGNHWSRPGKEDSDGVRVFDNGKAYEFSSNGKMRGDRMGGGKNQPFNAFDLFVEYEHNGDYREAIIAAAKELGLWNELHTLIFVEGRDNAAAIRDLMFKRGWVTRGFDNNRINIAGIADKGYQNILVWTYEDAVARTVSRMIPGAYPFTYPSNLDAVAMRQGGILETYLSSVLADAQNDMVEVVI